MIKDFFRVIFKSVWLPRLRKCNNEDLPGINILGTGPSMKDSIPYLMMHKESHIMALNDFAYSDFYAQITPRYYMLIDPVYWLKEVHEEGVKERDRLFDCLNTKTKWRIDLFIPSTGYKIGLVQNKLRMNKNISVRPINVTQATPRYSKFYFYLLDHNLTIPTQNVLATALVVAILLGYKKIGLHGAEHSWTENMRVNEDNILCTVNRHFYDEPEILRPWVGTNGKPMEISTLLFYLSNTFKSYKVIDRYAKQKRVRIINYTPKSYIDAFERGSLE